MPSLFASLERKPSVLRWIQETSRPICQRLKEKGHVIRHCDPARFLKGACMLSGGILLGIRMTGKAAAAVKAFKEYMGDRINGVYGADKQFSKRASQDNAQVRTLYESYLGKPLGHKSEELLHTKWFDKSGALKELTAKGVYPNPRHVKEFVASGYPYDE